MNKQYRVRIQDLPEELLQAIYEEFYRQYRYEVYKNDGKAPWRTFDEAFMVLAWQDGDDSTDRNAKYPMQEPMGVEL